MNPAANCTFETPDDAAAACIAYWSPLKPFFSPGRARVSVGTTGAHFTVAAAELEGFSRPLFGLAPLCAGGRDFEGRDLFLEGLANGADPAHPEFWGWPYERDQRLVESAAIGFTLAMAPEAFFDPLPGAAKDNIIAWLKACQLREVADNNWHFFHVLGSLGLSRVGAEHDLSVRERALDRLEGWYQDEGWYSDGSNRHFDHYIGFAMHFYGLLYASLVPGDAARAERMKSRAAAFAQQFCHWTDDTGATLAFGRSMTYRFAQASFWAALAYAGIEAPSHGVSRKLWASNMRWWAQRDWLDRDGVMPVGYGYPNLLMSESYNSPGSPYWAMKAFLPLALADDHGFWQQPETEPERPAVARLSVPGMLIQSQPGNNVALSCGNENAFPLRASAEKYAKFVYSTAYGFSIDPDPRQFPFCSHDGMLAFSEDGRQFHVRTANREARIDDGVLWAAWSPCRGVEVETWLIPANPWHLRVHRIVSDRSFETIEGGFAIPRDDHAPERVEADDGYARVYKDGHASIATDVPLAGAVLRTGTVSQPLPNASLYFPQTHVPQLRGTIDAGETWFAAAFVAMPGDVGGTMRDAVPPDAPDLAALNRLRDAAQPVKGLKYSEASRF